MAEVVSPPVVIPAEGEKKEGAEGEEPEDLPNPMYAKPVWNDPRKFTPYATMNIQLVTPQWGLMSRLFFNF